MIKIILRRPEWELIKNLFSDELFFAEKIFKKIKEIDFEQKNAVFSDYVIEHGDLIIKMSKRLTDSEDYEYYFYDENVELKPVLNWILKKMEKFEKIVGLISKKK